MKATESKPPTPVTHLRELMRVILEENSFKFNERHTASAMGTKMAVAFSVIYMADFEERLLEANSIKPFVWNRFTDDIFSLWDIPAEEVKTC